MHGNNQQERERKERRDEYLEILSEKAAEHAIKKVFGMIGVDVDRPESIEEFREDLRFGKKMRKAAGHGTFAFIAVASAAFAYAAWAGMVSYISNKIGS